MESAKVEVSKFTVDLINRIRVHFWPAVDGPGLGLSANRLTSPGAVGCWLSHYSAIQDAFNRRYEEILVLEDDLYVTEGFGECFDWIYAKLPAEWQLAWVGYWYRNLEQAYKSPPLYGKHIAQPKQIFGSHAYLLNRSGIETVYRSLNEQGIQDHIDRQLVGMSHVKQYCFVPSLIDYKPLPSDIHVLDHKGQPAAALRSKGTQQTVVNKDDLVVRKSAP
jgi:GR25 family glycosyltransferase involved in LPS biosynthesis